jgi:hypothetical protein
MHGGGFRVGCRSNFDDECMEFAKRGYVVASIDYRLGWVNGDEKQQVCNTNFCFKTACAPSQDDSCKASYSDSLNFALYRAIQDAAAAMRFIAHYTGVLNIDKNYLYIGGHSAGSVIATSFCYVGQNEFNNVMPNEVSVLGRINSSGNAFKDSFKIAGLFNNWGGLIDTSFINGPRDKIPMIAFHGIDDLVVPFAKGFPLGCKNGAYGVGYGSSSIYTRLTNRYPGLPVELYACYGGHGIFDGDPETDPKTLYRIQKAICFFNRVRSGDKSRAYIRIDKNENDITYQELDSISPVNCSFTARSNKNVYANSSMETRTNTIQNEFIVYPNPTASYATLHVNNEMPEINITLIDADAKILWTKKSINAKDIELPVQDLRAGLYFIIVETAKGSRVLKLIKAN